MADVETYDDLLIFGQTVLIIPDLINNMLKDFRKSGNSFPNSK